MRKEIALAAALLAAASPAFADAVRISQIDPSKLLANQSVKLYVSVVDNQAPVKGLTRENFKIKESVRAAEAGYKDAPITGFETGANYRDGIGFLLLVDNSGSMYLTVDGAPAKSAEDSRIGKAKRAIAAFLGSVSNPKDKIGLASFNAYYSSHSSPIEDKAKIESYLDRIAKPAKGEDYTEIYSSLVLAVDDFKRIKGRKAMIVLSDGQNEYYSEGEKKPHKVFGDKRYKFGESIAACQADGISVFVINFGVGQMKDKNLGRIAAETGGAIFDAGSAESLGSIYKVIMDQVLNEYLITYKATMEPADKKYVRVVFSSKGVSDSVDRFYFSSTVYGLAGRTPLWLLLIPFLLAAGLLFLLSRLDFARKKAAPSLDFLGGGATVVFKGATQKLSEGAKTVIAMEGGKTVVADDAKKVRGDNATIVFDQRTKTYRLDSTVALTVNNKSVKTKVLESGDVINLGGKTIVFDEGVK
jgi:Ca-activated chloride channel homolog